MISLEAVNFGYQDKPIFVNFNWNITPGETWAVIGPSGCGKSTLLALLSGLIQPQSGRVSVDGAILKRPRPKTGLILQDYGLLPWATVRENASLGIQVRSFYGADGVHAPSEENQFSDVDVMLERLGLKDISGKYPGQISGGQRQRTAIARTLVLHPDLFLLDEPFSSLDAPTRENLQDLILELIAENVLTSILVTHSIEEAVMMGRNILVLNSAPNQQAITFENPDSGRLGYRNSAAYLEMCKQVRSLLNEKNGQKFNNEK